jgi:hypothetical protein
MQRECVGNPNLIQWSVTQVLHGETWRTKCSTEKKVNEWLHWINMKDHARWKITQENKRDGTRENDAGCTILTHITIHFQCSIFFPENLMRFISSMCRTHINPPKLNSWNDFTHAHPRNFNFRICLAWV